MTKSIDVVEKYIRQIDEFWSSKCYFDALFLIASMLYNLHDLRVPKTIKNELQNKDKSLEFSDVILKSITTELISKFDRLKRIISIGEKYNDDEFLLLITYHTEIGVVVDFLSSKGIKLPVVDLKTLSKEILTAGKIEGNQKYFQSALSQFRKNSPFPVDALWLNQPSVAGR